MKDLPPLGERTDATFMLVRKVGEHAIVTTSDNQNALEQLLWADNEHERTLFQRMSKSIWDVLWTHRSGPRP